MLKCIVFLPSSAACSLLIYSLPLLGMPTALRLSTTFGLFVLSLFSVLLFKTSQKNGVSKTRLSNSRVRIISIVFSRKLLAGLFKEIKPELKFSSVLWLSGLVAVLSVIILFLKSELLLIAVVCFVNLACMTSLTYKFFENETEDTGRYYTSYYRITRFQMSTQKFFSVTVFMVAIDSILLLVKTVSTGFIPELAIGVFLVLLYTLFVAVFICDICCQQLYSHRDFNALFSLCISVVSLLPGMAMLVSLALNLKQRKMRTA